MKTRTGYAVLDAHITEMDSSSSNDLVPLDAQLISAVSEGDSDPLFLTMQILSEGISKNKRNYSRELVQQVADSINSNRPNGYQGHLSSEERKTKAPDPLVMWLGASSKEENGKQVVYARGYVMPYASKFKTYLRKAKALGKNVAMSIQGTAEKAVYNAQAKAYDLQGFVLDSVDFARDGSEGVANNGTLILTSEMVDENNNEGEKTVNKVEVLKETTVSEMQEHNPALISEIESMATATLVSEMTSITELVGDKPLEAIAEMQDGLKKAQLSSELSTKVKASGARPVIEGMILSEMKSDTENKTVSEMVDSVLRSPDAVAVLEQFTSTEPRVSGSRQKPEAKAERQFTVKR